MADDETLRIYSELARRGAVPAEHKPIVDELMRRGVIQGGDDAGLSERGKQRLAIEKDRNPSGSYTDRAMHSAMLGASDEITAGLQTVAEYPFRALSGDADIGAHWSDNLATQQAIVNRNKRLTEGGLGVASDVAGGLAMGAPKAAAGVVAGAAPTFWETTKQLAKVGGTFGGAHAFLDTDGGVGDRLSAVPGGVVEGAASANVLGHGINALLRGRGFLQQRRAERARAADDVANAFESEGVPVFAPAIAQNALLQGAARGIGDTFVGGPIQQGARQTVRALEGRIADRIDTAAGGSQTAADAGRETQAFLKRQLTERSIPSDEVAAMSPQQWQDVSGVGPAPNANIKSPRVPPVKPEPWNPQRRTVTDDEVASAMPSIERGAPEMPRQITEADVSVPPEITRQFADAKAAADAGRKFWEQNGQKYNDLIKQYNQLTRYGTRDPAVADQAARIMSDIKALEIPLTNARAAVEAEEPAFQALRQARMQRIKAAQDAEYKRVSDDAEQNFMLRTAEARRATKEKLQTVADAEHINDLNDPLRKTAWENKEANRARFETERAQKASDDRFNADLSLRKARTEREPFQLGRSKETYPTEFDAAYSAASANAPKIQPELMAPGTETSKLITSLGMQARGQMRLPGWKPTQGLTQELAAELQRSFGTDITTALVRYAEPGFKPGVQGLRDIRTSIGRAIGDARRASQQGLPRGSDETKLARLYDAVTEDIHTALRSAGGDTASRQLREIDAGYKEFINDLRRPLAKIYGEQVDPVQAIGELVKAAGPNGKIDVLRRAYRVFDDKGDRVKLTASILNNMKQGGTEGFLKAWRALSPDAKRIMSEGPSGELIRGIERLAALAIRMEPYAGMARDPGGSIARSLGRAINTGNVSLVALGHFISMPMALAGAVGANAAARIMVKPWFGIWLRRAPAVLNNGPMSKEWLSYVGRLGAAIERDTNIGAATKNAIIDAMIGPAKADDGKVSLFTSLEQPPSPDEVAKSIKDGVTHFDFDLDQPGGVEAAAAVKKAGGKVTAYHVGGGGGRQWGGKAAGEEVRKYKDPAELAQLTDEVKSLVAKGADLIHFDNTHRMGWKTLLGVAEAIKAGGAGIAAKNNPERWNKILDKRPDLKPDYAMIEDAMFDADETQEAADLAAKGVPVYVVGFKTPLDPKKHPVTEDYAQAYHKANPWARLIIMQDEKAFEGRGAVKLGEK